MRVILFALFLTGAIASTTPAGKCFTEAQCGVGECCFRQTGPLIASKRQNLDNLFSTSLGVCKKYLLEGQHCNVFDQWNYHCSCAPGLRCDYKLPSTTTTSSPLQWMRAARTLAASPDLYRCVPTK
ncbi:uncharacterized protein LOC134249260 [Saccostrea cucullata]|uniref:uncharacterized protein LOC134249260 n=1 Tax=Saccostrea cuccullata TaxID=36930 RepID=UPI002ED1812D